MPDPSIHQKVLAILQCETGCGCGARGFKALGELHDQAPEKTQEVLVSLLDSPVQKVRRGAVAALLFLRGHEVSVQPSAEALAEHLLHNSDERVRDCCAVLLLSVDGPVVARAFIAALADPSEDVAEMDKTKEFAEELIKVFCPDGTLLPTWDKLDTILTKARAIAAGNRPWQ